MKYLRYLVLAICISVFPLTTAMTCNPSQQRLTYNTLASVGSAVNSAYAAYNDQVVAGKATFSPTVATKYNEFQAAYAVAVNLAQNSTSAVAPQNVVDLSNSVLALIKQFSTK